MQFPLAPVPYDGRTAPDRYNNPGGAYPRQAGTNFGMVGYGVIGGGHPIAHYPSAAHGVAANMDHFRSLYRPGMTVGEARGLWVTGKRGTVMDLPGMDSKAVINPKHLQDPNWMRSWMRGTAKAEGHSGLDDTTIDQGFGWYKQGAAGNEMRDYNWDEALPMEAGGQAPMMRPPMPAGMAQRAPQQQQAQPSFMDDIRSRLLNPLTLAGLAGLESASRGGSAFEGMSRGMQMGSAFEQSRKSEAQKQAIERLFSDTSKLGQLPPALVEIARATGDPSPIVQHLIKQQTAGQTDDIKEFEYAKKLGFQGNFQDWMVTKKPNNGEYNKNLVYGTDAQGNIVPMQAGTRGDLVASRLPPGVTLQRDPIKMDAGDSFILLDPTTRQPIGQVKKNLAEAERQKVLGEAGGKAQTDLGTKLANADYTLQVVDSVLGDKGTPANFGLIGRVPNLPGSDASNAAAKIEQIKSRAFLEAFNALRGGGAITEAEGQKATNSLIRAQSAQSYQAFEQALREFKEQVKTGMRLARERASAGTSASPAAPVQSRRLKFNPQTGELE